MYEGVEESNTIVTTIEVNTILLANKKKGYRLCAMII